MSSTHDVTISAFDLDRLERELAAVTEQRDRLADIVIRIGWPARGTADDIATVGDFAAEIQATWKYEELEALQSQTLAAVKGGSDEVRN
jgi:glutamate/tyrosine decarboxylase-like PLP-dependent enzyme